jgi:hypothetical protein
MVCFMCVQDVSLAGELRAKAGAEFAELEEELSR